MGFFGKLFEKKECDICGGEIGLLRNRKLSDGNMCKDCAALLSPWFDGRRHATIDEINEQLEYRKGNEEFVEQFTPTRSLGDYYKVLVDEDNGEFLVTNQRKWRDDNPDVLDLTMVTGVDVDIEESESEIYKTDKDGNSVSHRPPKYRHEYDFKVTIHVNHQFFDQMSFELNTVSVTIEEVRGGFNASFNAENNPEYRKYREMAEEIKEVLLNGREKFRELEEVECAPKIATTCPYCGATTTPDDSGRCEFCGGAING